MPTARLHCLISLGVLEGGVGVRAFVVCPDALPVDLGLLRLSEGQFSGISTNVLRLFFIPYLSHSLSFPTSFFGRFLTR